MEVVSAAGLLLLLASLVLPITVFPAALSRLTPCCQRTTDALLHLLLTDVEPSAVSAACVMSAAMNAD